MCPFTNMSNISPADFPAARGTAGAPAPARLFGRTFSRDSAGRARFANFLVFFSAAPPGDAASRKEVFQPHLPVRLPCYDLAPITRFTLGRPSRSRTSGTTDFHGLTGGVYKARERIHRAMADARLLANPTSRSRVADSDPN